MNYLNTRTNEVVSVVSKKAGIVVVADATGKEHKLPEGTFKRWYKETEAEVSTKSAEAAKDTDAPAEAKTPTVKKVKAKKEKVAKEPKPKAGPHALLPFLEEFAKEQKIELFESNVKSFRAFKEKGHYVLPFTFNTKNVTLWMRSAVAESIGLEFKKANHTYDAHIQLTGSGDAEKEIVRNVFAAAKQNFLDRQAKSEAKKSTKKESKKAEKKSTEKVAVEA